MGWTVSGSNPFGARISAPVQTGPGVHLVPYIEYRVIPKGRGKAAWALL